MDEPAFLDSVIVIDYLNGVAAAGAYLKQLVPGWGISLVTYAEVLTGAPPRVSQPRVLIWTPFRCTT